ncbi:glycosyltransferase [Candidatus Saccharibacteria bacterium]|nr:MAG: glycosyltransferase [Candidatus Saccharibacteria bacterium]
MNTPAVSIIMPTYNRGYAIGYAIESVLSQTYDEWELIVVDDGSTDNTSELIRGYHDKRITYIKQFNAGAASARNHGLSVSRGTLVAYLDSDNELLPHYLATMLKLFTRNPQTVFSIPRAHRTLELYENGILVKTIDDSADTPLGLTLKDIFMKKLHFDANGFMHLRSLYDQGIRWDETLGAMEDWDIAMTIGEKYPHGFLYVEEVLYNYHQRYGGDGVVSSKTYSDWADIFEAIYRKHKNDTLLVGQQWYPAKVQKWRKFQQDFEAGKLPPYHLYYFQ